MQLKGCISDIPRRIVPYTWPVVLETPCKSSLSFFDQIPWRTSKWLLHWVWKPSCQSSFHRARGRICPAANICELFWRPSNYWFPAEQTWSRLFWTESDLFFRKMRFWIVWLCWTLASLESSSRKSSFCTPFSILLPWTCPFWSYQVLPAPISSGQLNRGSIL